jgi:(1->4)-alpha-D-glucan 1-alpha-D-glucosylmutase
VGMEKDHIVAFSRRLAEDMVVTVTPRLVVGLTGGKEVAPLGEEVWGDTMLLLPEEDRGRRYRQLLTGEVLAVEDAAGGPGLAMAKVLAEFPVALLIRLA